jgi:hypothetical protein
VHFIIEGKYALEELRVREWFIVAKNCDGPNITKIPAIILAKKLHEKSFDL